MTTTPHTVEGHPIIVGEEYAMRDGRKARVICTDRRHPNFPVVVLIKTDDIEIQFAASIYGRCNSNQMDGNSDLMRPWKEPSPYDTHKGWADFPLAEWRVVYANKGVWYGTGDKPEPMHKHGFWLFRNKCKNWLHPTQRLPADNWAESYRDRPEGV